MRVASIGTSGRLGEGAPSIYSSSPLRILREEVSSASRSIRPPGLPGGKVPLARFPVYQPPRLV